MIFYGCFVWPRAKWKWWPLAGEKSVMAPGRYRTWLLHAPKYQKAKQKKSVARRLNEAPWKLVSTRDVITGSDGDVISTGSGHGKIPMNQTQLPVNSIKQTNQPKCAVLFSAGLNIRLRLAAGKWWRKSRERKRVQSHGKDHQGEGAGGWVGEKIKSIQLGINASRCTSERW